MVSAIRKSEFCCPCAFPCTNAEDRSPFLDQSTGFRFARGTVLWREGEPATWMLVVGSGAVLLRKTEPRGGHTVLGLLTRGDMVGVEALLEGRVRPTEAVALAAGRYRRIDSDQVAKVLKKSPELWPAVLEASCDRTAQAAERADAPGKGPVHARLALFFVRLSESVGIREARGVFLPLPLRHRDLADIVGCRPETIARVLSGWRAKGLMSRQREGYVVERLPALRQLVVEG
ncbi:MAG: CRP-like cAMP-binding protein [Kiritimatiellia bacterium]|jgi:CRP-like cAMP-binding protein